MRIVWQCILFTFITCGIYGLVWMYQIGSDLRGFLGRGEPNPGLDIVLCFVTCGLWGIYVWYRYAQLTLEAQGKAGIRPNDVTIPSLLCAIFGLSIVSMALVQTELNRLWTEGRAGQVQGAF